MEIEQLEALIRRHRQLTASAAELLSEANEIKAQVDDATEVGFRLTVDGIDATKRAANRSFSLLFAVTNLTPEERAACKVERFDEKMVRALVEENGMLEACMVAKEDAKPVVKLG